MLPNVNFRIYRTHCGWEWQEAEKMAGRTRLLKAVEFAGGIQSLSAWIVRCVWRGSGGTTDEAMTKRVA